MDIVWTVVIVMSWQTMRTTAHRVAASMTIEIFSIAILTRFLLRLTHSHLPISFYSWLGRWWSHSWPSFRSSVVNRSMWLRRTMLLSQQLFQRTLRS